MNTYKTKKEVIDHLNGLADLDLLYNHSQGWSNTCAHYQLSHGEYDKPDYRPTRYRDGWGIAKVYYYYQGTFNAPNQHRVDLSACVNNAYDDDDNNINYELVETLY